MNLTANQGPREVNKWLITIAVMAGTFMEIIDTTVVNVALPHMAGSLSAGVDEATWVLTAYLVSNAVVLPITGWLSALFGRKRFLMICLVLFTVASMLCGSAPNLESLIVFRVFQGIGGGALQPISQAILLESFPVRERGMAMAVWGIGVIFAPIVGPLLGGWITDNLSWRWAFYINFPIGVLSLIMTALFIIYNRLTMFFCQHGPDNGMGAFDFMINRLADIMEQSDTPCKFCIESQFGRHDAA